MRQYIRDLRWDRDDLGEYWLADTCDAFGNPTGKTGSFHILTEEAVRLPREAQEAALSALYFLFTDEMETTLIIRKREEKAPGWVRKLYRKALALAMSVVEYLDISKWQPANQINYPLVKQGGIPALWLRCSIGLSADEQFPLHWENALNAEIWVAVYHFFRSNIDGVLQANKIWEVLQGLIDRLGFVPLILLDVESTDGISNDVRLARLKQCIDKLNALILARTGQVERVGIYSSPGFADASLTPTPAWLKSTVVGSRIWQWVAHYIDAPLPTQPKNWPVINRVGWQNGIAGKHSHVAYPVPGFGEMQVDHNIAFLSADDFALLMGFSPSLPPPGQTSGLVFIVTADALNIRTGPGINYPILRQVQNGTELTAENVGGVNAWAEIANNEWAAVQINSSRHMEPKL